LLSRWALLPCLPGWHLVVSGVLDRASVAAPLVSLFDWLVLRKRAWQGLTT
jgi:hypothetical protein